MSYPDSYWKGKSRFTKRKGRTTAKDRQQDRKINKLVRAVPRKEYGNLSPSTGVDLTNLAQYIIMNPIIQGSEITQRDGQDIQDKMLEFRAQVFRSASTNNSCRLILFWDKQSNGVVPAAGTDLLQSIAGLDMYNSPYQHDTVPNRFTILKDIRFTLNDQVPQKTIYFKRKVNKKATFASNVGAVPITGNLAMLYMSDSTTAPPVMHYFFRNHFES